jgi:hypothetical protein
LAASSPTPNPEPSGFATFTSLAWGIPFSRLAAPSPAGDHAQHESRGRQHRVAGPRPPFTNSHTGGGARQRIRLPRPLLSRPPQPPPFAAASTPSAAPRALPAAALRPPSARAAARCVSRCCGSRREAPGSVLLQVSVHPATPPANLPLGLGPCRLQSFRPRHLHTTLHLLSRSSPFRRRQARRPLSFPRRRHHLPHHRSPPCRLRRRHPRPSRRRRRSSLRIRRHRHR